MSQIQQEEPQEISIQDLELSLQVYEIQSQEKLKKLEQIFQDKKHVDLSKMFYEERSSLEIKFQNIVSDLSEFLINQEIASTDKLRKTFYKILENPLTFLFKVSRFEIFNLRLNAFDIELQPIEAIVQLGNSIKTNIDDYLKIVEKLDTKYTGGEYKSFTEFLTEAKIRLIQDQIFIFYSYLRKGGNIIKKKFEDKIKVVQIYNKIQQKLLQRFIAGGDLKTLKELSILNYQIFLFEPTYDVLCFYLKLPLRAQFQEIFRELESIATKAKQTSNFDIFILIFLRYSNEIFVKLDQQGIDPVFSKYIENTLRSLLELWGCRLCHYQQFLELFQKLINLHPNKASILTLCGQHNPNLQKDDIVLLRTHFKLDLMQKHSQLLSLFKPKSIEETNNFLSMLYHKIFYNIDFSSISREEFLDLLQLINGNTSINEFFAIVQKALKEWNHSIDLLNFHKFISSEFNYPSLSRPKILQSIRLFNNVFVLQSKGIKQFQVMIKNNNIKRSFVSLSQFLLKNQQGMKLIKEQESLSIFLIDFLEFAKRTFTPNEQWDQICLTFSQKLNILGKSYIQKAITIIRSILIEYPEYFTVKTISQIIQNLLHAERSLQITTSETISLINNAIMNQTSKNNDQLKKFKYFHLSAKAKISITQQQQEFLKRYAFINGDIIQPKNLGCFTFSELQIVTNPIQFDKVMDNYYFTLDNNSKRYVQYLAVDFIRLIDQKNHQRANINLLIITNLVDNYPICLPLLCSTRIRLQNNLTKRFAEVLVSNISPVCLSLLKKICKCRIIRYKNGKDFIKQEILPVILKETIKLLNQGSQHKEHYVLLSICLTNYKLSELKIDLVQKSIELIKYKLSSTGDQQIVYTLSQVQFDILKVFFEKKENDMRKSGLVKIFNELAWNQVRTKSANIQSSETVKEYKKNVISDQIMITPFAISHDFNAQQTKLQKLAEIKKTQTPQRHKDIFPSEILQTNSKITSPDIQAKKQDYKIINLTSLKYNLQSRLGKEINNACLSEGFRLVVNNKEIISDVQLNEQNNTLVQYYIKQFQLPELSSAMVVKYIHAIINKQLQYSTIFSNYTNLQKLFFALILLLRFYVQKYTAKAEEATFVDKLLKISEEERINKSKEIMNILIKIGYTNIWAQSFNSSKKLSYFKQLMQKTTYSDQSEEQTFLSWILKLTIEKQEYKIELNGLLQSIFNTRPKDQTSLMYKISIDRLLLNSIMKSLEIQNLSYISLLFHSNFNNLRLYTDQLHEGLKSLNISSKNRAFNQYIQLSKDTDDVQFFTPLKLFKYNFGFFIKIESQGYNFKKSQQQKLSRQRVIKLLRNNPNNQTLLSKIQNIIEQYEQQLQKLQLNIANRVKSFYLVTKLRDLSYQNSFTICLLYQILKEKKFQSTLIVNKIKEIQIFSLITKMYNDLVKFDSSDADEFVVKDKFSIQNQVNLCTTRRYAHSINKVYQKCELQFDQIYQRCIDVLKVFFVTQEGRQWSSQLNIYPPFLIKSFIDHEVRIKFIEQQRGKINTNLKKIPLIQLTCQENSYSSLLKSLRQLDKTYLLSKDTFKIKYKNASFSFNEFIQPLKEHLTSSETFHKSKDGLLLFNKYKTSEKTLEEIQILGLIVGYCIYHGITIDLPLHSSIISALSFNICDSDDLIDVDFKIWQDLRNTMSAIDSKELNLTFSYVFQSLTNLKPQRIQLIDKGTSKKVNNLNRQEYCDLVCCYLLYNTILKQIKRFLSAVIYICPLKIVSSMRIKQIHNILLSKNSNYSKNILLKHMKKRGLVLPNSCLIKGIRYQNSKDYQTVQWLCEIIQENLKIKEKLWHDECNMFVCTWLGQGVVVDVDLKMIAIGRINSKAELKQTLQKLIF